MTLREAYMPFGATITQTCRLLHYPISQSIKGQVASHPCPVVLSSNSGYALIVGGNWNNSDNAGVSYLNNSNGDANDNYGSRLNFSPITKSKITVIATAPECERNKPTILTRTEPDWGMERQNRVKAMGQVSR